MSAQATFGIPRISFESPSAVVGPGLIVEIKENEKLAVHRGVFSDTKLLDAGEFAPRTTLVPASYAFDKTTPGTAQTLKCTHPVGAEVIVIDPKDLRARGGRKQYEQGQNDKTRYKSHAAGLDAVGASVSQYLAEEKFSPIYSWISEEHVR